MHKSATKCNETLGKWYKNKHGASKIIDTLETYHLLDKVIYGTLADPITPDYVRDVNDLEKKRRTIPKEAKRVEKMGQ
jgi:hypothetical protein